ncbi:MULTISPECIES: CaiB/BaiF CoA-transferase family protein [unclassified Mycobacterium]|uniref:CaiB/BaiF CoA transferase family protein n=1 Tax=unclassified Mycobacterium TaxID=2642494 RepID=UPI0007FBF0FE|nr:MULTISPECIES: CoA transferase [unclassified Mycobacterium]OBG78206.1 formyl-CoA transferase [Mycobacterium sp. E1214]OBH23200.1 formyl-CoA transferase [Mycobacterium sp. E1319]
MDRFNGGPLDGVRVLELGNYIAAPTAGRLLADFGAEVIKIERPETGDELRRWRLYSGTTSMLFRTINRNKKSVILDLKSRGGQAAVRELARSCDIVLENFRPGTLERWGIGPQELCVDNPDLIVVRVSAYGQTGPRSREPGFAAVAEAMAGLRALTGEPDRPPSRTGVSIGDSLAGIYAAFGALIAMHQRHKDRIAGRYTQIADRTVDVALTEAIFSVMESLVPEHDAYGVTRTRCGGRLEGVAPSNAYPCADGRWVVIAGNGDAIYRRLMRLIDRADLAEDPRLADNALRWQARDELDDAIGAWTARTPAAEALAALAEAAVPAGPINTAADIKVDEQFLARGMIQRLPVSTGTEDLPDVAFPGIVPRIGDRPRGIQSLGPDLGEHTEEVLGALDGYPGGLGVEELIG